MAVNFAGLLDRKYANLETETAGQNRLRDAQATSTLGAMDSENALRRAQAYSTQQQGSTYAPLAQSTIAGTQADIGLKGAQAYLAGQQGATLMPLANASIQGTLAGIGETNARSGYYGAQSNLANAGAEASRYDFLPAEAAMRGRLHGETSNERIGYGLGPYLGIPSPNGVGPQTRMAPINDTQKYASGTSNVQKGAPMAQAPAPPLLHPDGQINFHGVMHHAMQAMHAAGGATTVSGKAPATAAPAQYPTGQTSGGPSFGTRTPLTGTVGAAGGASAIQAKGGTAKVPGKGAPNKDSVKAVLAPQEAVLNAGAADHMGRGAISVLNALGAAKMAQQGMPPETPPTAHGVPGPARGAPPKGKGAPPARGALPAAKGKGAPPAKGKVAPAKKGK